MGTTFRYTYLYPYSTAMRSVAKVNYSVKVGQMYLASKSE